MNQLDLNKKYIMELGRFFLIRGIRAGTLEGWYLMDSIPESISSPTSRITKYGQRIHLIFYEHRVSIFGDLAPNKRGVISDFGCDREWFLKHMTQKQLCERFLDLEYQPGKAKQDLNTSIIQQLKTAMDYQDGAEIARLHELELIAQDEADIMFETPETLRFFIEPFFDGPITFGWDFNTEDSALLLAIQKRFNELYELEFSDD